MILVNFKIMQKIIVANFKMNLVLKFEIENWIKGFLSYAI